MFPWLLKPEPVPWFSLLPSSSTRSPALVPILLWTLQRPLGKSNEASGKAWHKSLSSPSNFLATQTPPAPGRAPTEEQNGDACAHFRGRRAPGWRCEGAVGSERPRRPAPWSLRMSSPVLFTSPSIVSETGHKVKFYCWHRTGIPSSLKTTAANRYIKSHLQPRFPEHLGNTVQWAPRSCEALRTCKVGAIIKQLKANAYSGLIRKSTHFLPQNRNQNF